MKTLIGKLAVALLITLAALQAQADVFIRIAPPPLPYYEQPLVPADGYLWTPGYWAWDDEDGDYFWVPGTWVLAPEPGYLWTPGYWAWDDFGYGYGWRPGYWGPHVGYYGGINYGYGYYGDGYVGGRWYGNRFSYNRAVNNVNVVYIHNTYNTTVINQPENHTSYHGGDGGLRTRPRPEDERAERDRHLGWTQSQNAHQDEARHDRGQFASVNQGRPQIGATPRPSEFRDPGAIAVRPPAFEHEDRRDDPRQGFGNERRDLPGAHPPPPSEPQVQQRPFSQPGREPRTPRQPFNTEDRGQFDHLERQNAQPFNPPADRGATRQQVERRTAPEPRMPPGRPIENRAPPQAAAARPAGPPAMREARPPQNTPREGRRDRD